MPWINEIWRPGVTSEDLEDSGDYPSLDMKLAAALLKTFPVELKRKVEIMEEQMQLRHKIVTGRQMVLLVLRHLSISKIDAFFVELEDLQRLRIHNGDVAEFMYQWFYLISGMDPERYPPDHVCENCLSKQFRKADCMTEAMKHYDWGIRQLGQEKNYLTFGCSHQK